MHLWVVRSCLIACFLFSFSVLFAQTPGQLPPATPEETIESKAPASTDSSQSGAETTATAPDTSPSADPQDPGKTSASAAGRTKPGAATTTTPYVFPTARHMNMYWLKNTIGPKALLGATFTASWNQWVADTPSEWAKDATGFGQRYGSSLLDNAVNTTSLVWISRATGQDPRYHRCDCAGLWPRTRHAIQLAFVSYNRNGGLSFSPAKMISPFTGPMVTRNTIYPDRFGPSNAARGGAYYVAGSIGWNMVREFIWNIW